MFVVAAIEEDRLLWGAVAPVGRRVVKGRVARPRGLGTGRDFDPVGGELGLVVDQECQSEARTRKE